MCHILGCSLRCQNLVSQIRLSLVHFYFYYLQNKSLCALWALSVIRFQKPPSYALLCIPSVKLIIIAPSVLLEHPCCTQRLFFWLGLQLMLCMHRVPRTPPSVTACCPGQQMPRPARARPGDFDSSKHSCALEHLPDIMGFCIPWCDISCYFKFHSVSDGMNADCFWWR